MLHGHAVTAETTEIIRSPMTKSLSYLQCCGDVTTLHPREAVVVVGILPVCGQATLLPVIVGTVRLDYVHSLNKM